MLSTDSFEVALMYAANPGGDAAPSAPQKRGRSLEGESNTLACRLMDIARKAHAQREKAPAEFVRDF